MKDDDVGCRLHHRRAWPFARQRFKLRQLATKEWTGGRSVKPTRAQGKNVYSSNFLFSFSSFLALALFPFFPFPFYYLNPSILGSFYLFTFLYIHQSNTLVLIDSDIIILLHSGITEKQ